MSGRIVQSHNHGVSDCHEHPVGACMVVIDPNDIAQIERLRDYLETEYDWFGMREDNTIEHLADALRSLIEPPKPTEVYEHYTQTNPRDGKPVVAICGKIWRPGAANTVSIGKCPECAETIECGWLT